MGITHTVERYTEKSTPPPTSGTRLNQRRSFWPAVFDEARQCPGEWVRVLKWFHKATAQQVASDIRNAHQRQEEKMRVKGVQPGDVWDARWANDPSDPDTTHFYIWIRLASQAS